MSKDPEKIRQQIQALKDDLKEAKKDKEKSAKRAVSRAAERAGLHKMDLSPEELENEFKALAKRLKATQKNQDNPQTNDTTDQEPRGISGQSVN